VAPRYQRKDSFHQRAKREGYRSRAAYKLAEIADRQRLLPPGARVVDLGCWPGGWLQVAAERVGPSGRVVGVDLAAIDPPLGNANVVALRGDIAQPTVIAEILAALGGPADVLLCDAAPKLTGIRDADRAAEEALLEAVEAALPRLLRPGGDLLCKLLDGPEAVAVARRIGAAFRESRTLKPEATRKGSAERYLLAHAFETPKKGS
jgi:23S rRNA (uridine2552-2'-O)-methyltransferase